MSKRQRHCGWCRSYADCKGAPTMFDDSPVIGQYSTPCSHFKYKKKEEK